MIKDKIWKLPIYPLYGFFHSRSKGKNENFSSIRINCYKITLISRHCTISWLDIDVGTFCLVSGLHQHHLGSRDWDWDFNWNQQRCVGVILIYTNTYYCIFNAIHDIYSFKILIYTYIYWKMPMSKASDTHNGWTYLGWSKKGMLGLY